MPAVDLLRSITEALKDTHCLKCSENRTKLWLVESELVTMAMNGIADREGRGSPGPNLFAPDDESDTEQEMTNIMSKVSLQILQVIGNRICHSCD